MLKIMRKHAKQRLGERTTINEKELSSIINKKLYVNLGTKPGLHKTHLLIYSVKDDAYFVLVQDDINGDIITVWTEEYYNNLAMKITDEDKEKAKSLIINQESEDDCSFIASVIYIDEKGNNRSKDILKFRTENSIPLTEMYFIDIFIKTGKLKEAMKEKGININNILGYSVKASISHRFFIDTNKLKIGK